MKNLLLVFIVSLVALVATAADSAAFVVEDQPSIEVAVITNLDSVDLAILPVKADTVIATPVHNTPLPGYVKTYQYQVRAIKSKTYSCAGFGAFIQSDGDTADSNEADATVDDDDSNVWLSWIIGNKTILLALLLALSEVLALIPGISQNGIFQSIYSWLKVKSA